MVAAVGEGCRWGNKPQRRCSAADCSLELPLGHVGRLTDPSQFPSSIPSLMEHGSDPCGWMRSSNVLYWDRPKSSPRRKLGQKSAAARQGHSPDPPLYHLLAPLRHPAVNSRPKRLRAARGRRAASVTFAGLPLRRWAFGDVLDSSNVRAVACGGGLAGWPCKFWPHCPPPPASPHRPFVAGDADGARRRRRAAVAGWRRAVSRPHTLQTGGWRAGTTLEGRS